MKIPNHPWQSLGIRFAATLGKSWFLQSAREASGGKPGSAKRKSQLEEKNARSLPRDFPAGTAGVSVTGLSLSSVGKSSSVSKTVWTVFSYLFLGFLDECPAPASLPPATSSPAAISPLFHKLHHATSIAQLVSPDLCPCPTILSDMCQNPVRNMPVPELCQSCTSIMKPVI